MTLIAEHMKSAAAGTGEVRERILLAAARCFSASGFHSTSMQQICASAQMSPGGVYRYFSSKDDIIAAIADHVRQRNNEYFGRMAAEGANLQTFCDVGFACLNDQMNGPEGGLFCEVVAEAQRNPQIRVPFENSYKESREMLRAVLARLQSQSQIEPSLDIDAVASMLMAIGDGLLMRSRLDPEMNFAALWPALNELILRMLLPTASASTQPTKETPVQS